MNTIDKLSYITNLLFNKIEDTEIDLSEEECDNIVNYSKDIRKELRQSEKLEKVFEILKKKRLSIVYFVYEIRADKNARNYSDYKYWAFNKVKSKDDLLAEDEFNLLLKEVFGNDKH